MTLDEGSDAEQQTPRKMETCHELANLIERCIDRFVQQLMDAPEEVRDSHSQAMEEGIEDLRDRAEMGLDDTWLALAPDGRIHIYVPYLDEDPRVMSIPDAMARIGFEQLLEHVQYELGALQVTLALAEL